MATPCVELPETVGGEIVTPARASFCQCPVRDIILVPAGYWTLCLTSVPLAIQLLDKCGSKPIMLAKVIGKG